jgi:hypothetical protein
MAANASTEQKAAMTMIGPPRRESVPKPEISRWSAYEHICEQCSARFLDQRLAGDRIRLCSNKCARGRRNAQQRQRRKRHPLDYQAINASRARKRAEGRAGRSCAHCGVLIEAARSTKRFCSDLCRARAHRQRAAMNSPNS